MSRGDVLGSAVASWPDALALTDGVRRWTYQDLAETVAPLRARLDGARAALVLDPSAGAVIGLHAALSSGALVAPLNPRLTEAELSASLAAITPDHVVTSRAHERRVADAAWAAGMGLDRDGIAPAQGTPTGSGGDLVLLRCSRTGRRAAPSSPDAGAGDALAVVWTSGTAGRPRGVLLLEAAFRHSAEASRERLGLGPKDRWYLSLSIGHVGGLALVLRAAMLGAGLVTRGGPDIADLSDLIDSGEVTHASLVPIQFRRLIEHRGERPLPATLRCLLVGGGPAHRDLVERAVAAGYPAALTYGLTEATSQVATAPPALVREKPGTVGPPLRGVDVRIAPDREILVRGPTLAAGTLGGDALAVDDEGWLHTGDLGELDEAGHLWITGRISDRIVTGGFTVDPTEIEAVLEAHPAVREVAAVGIPDQEWGERIVAVVVLEHGRATDRLDGGSGGAVRDVVSELEALCRGRLTSPKVPRRWLVLDALPRNPNGKVDRDQVGSLVVSP